MTIKGSFRLDDYASPWTPTATENRKAIGDGWRLADEFAGLHLEALESISKRAGRKPSDQELASILIASHAFNLYAATLRLIIHGQFDIASYMLRALLDAQGLFYAISRKSDLAAKFLNDQLKASTARKFVVRDLRNNGMKQDADFLDQRWSDESDAANKLAHACAIHAGKLIEQNNGSITPVLCGRADQAEAPMMCLAALEDELWFVTWLQVFHAAVLLPDWINSFDQAKNLYKPWAAAVAGPLVKRS